MEVGNRVCVGSIRFSNICFGMYSTNSCLGGSFTGGGMRLSSDALVNNNEFSSGFEKGRGGKKNPLSCSGFLVGAIRCHGGLNWSEANNGVSLPFILPFVKDGCELR